MNLLEQHVFLQNVGHSFVNACEIFFFYFSLRERENTRWEEGETIETMYHSTNMDFFWKVRRHSWRGGEGGVDSMSFQVASAKNAMLNKKG